MAIRKYLRVQFGLYITSRIPHRVRHSPFLSTAGRNNENWTKMSRDNILYFYTDETLSRDQEVVAPQETEISFRSFIHSVYLLSSIHHSVYI